MVMELQFVGLETNQYIPVCNSSDGRVWTTRFFNLLFDPVLIFYRFVTSFFESKIPPKLLQDFSIPDLSDIEAHRFAKEKMDEFHLPELSRPALLTIHRFFLELTKGNGAIQGAFFFHDQSSGKKFQYTGPLKDGLDHLKLYDFLKQVYNQKDQGKTLKVTVLFSGVINPCLGRIFVEKEKHAMTLSAECADRISYRDYTLDSFYREDAAVDAVDSFFKNAIT